MINRDIAYYLEFKNKRGWDMRLQIIPAGGAKNISTFEWRELKSVVVGLGNAQFDFEDVPIGMMKAPTLTIDMDLTNNTDDNLVELLLNPHYEYYVGTKTSTIFTLATNYGSGAVNKFVFVGGQSFEIGNELTLNSNHELVKISLKLIDLMKLILESTLTDSFCYHCVSNLVPARNVTDGSIPPLYGFLSQAYPTFNSNLIERSAANDMSVNHKYYKLIEVFGSAGIFTYIESLVNIWLRRFGESYAKGLTGIHNVLHPFTFYTLTTEPIFLDQLLNEKGDILDKEFIEILGLVTITNVSTSEVSTRGLFVADSGNESFHEYKYLYELLSVISENFCTKCKWQTITTDNETDGYYVPVYSMGFYKPFENSLIEEYADISDLKVISDRTYDVVTVSNVYKSCECEFPNLSGDNISNISEEQSGLVNQESWNVTMCLYSIPICIYEKRTYLRQMQRYNSPVGIMELLHGSSALDDGFHSEYLHDNPVEFPRISQYPLESFTPTDDFVKFKVNGWVVTTQRQNTLANCINGWFVSTFSSTDITKRTLTLEMDGIILSAWSVGDAFILPAIVGSAARVENVLMSMDIDWLNGTAECEFVSIS